jgi:hypothetical protein
LSDELVEDKVGLWLGLEWGERWSSGGRIWLGRRPRVGVLQAEPKPKTECKCEDNSNDSTDNDDEDERTSFGDSHCHG